MHFNEYNYRSGIDEIDISICSPILDFGSGSFEVANT